MGQPICQWCEHEFPERLEYKPKRIYSDIKLILCLQCYHNLRQVIQWGPTDYQFKDASELVKHYWDDFIYED